MVDSEKSKGIRELKELVNTDDYTKSDILTLIDRLEEEVSIRREAEEKAKILANIDSLTELTNRRYFYEKVSLILNSKYNTDNTYGILFIIDIDDFKNINDSLGHLTGDECLRKVSKRLVADISLFQGDISLSRIDGDEFAFMIGTLSIGYEKVREKAIEYANQIIEKFQRQIELNNRLYS